MSSEPVLNPLVFQCDNCRTIVGDTFSMIGSDPDLRVIGLERASNVTVDESALNVVSLGKTKDAGSTYYHLKCSKCSAKLGRMYRTTDAAMDAFRGKYCFTQSAVGAYELGTGSGGGDEKSGVDQVFAWSREVTELKQQLLKVQEMMILFGDQLSALGVNGNVNKTDELPREAPVESLKRNVPADERQEPHLQRSTEIKRRKTSHK